MHLSPFRKALVCLSLLLSPAIHSAEKPNIIFIFADDWGYGDVGVHGSTFCKTPHLDQMAKEGIDFTQFTVNSPVCSPSRVAVNTGHFPARYCIHQHFAGVTGNRDKGMPDWLDLQAPSLPRMMQNSGYVTGHFGKWHLGAAGKLASEDKYGYDEFATFNGSKINDIPKRGLSSVEHASDFIRKHKAKPFFVNLWLHETHTAHFPLAKYLEQFKDLDEQKKVYASVIAEGDEGVGRIFALLKELDIDDNTLVVFSSDNGPEVTKSIKNKLHKPEKNGKDALGGYYSVGESGGLKGKKRSLFSGGIRVPLIVRWPAVTPKGVIDKTSVITAVDLLPTFVAIAGGELAEGFAPDGEDVKAAFKGESFQRSMPIFWEWKGGEDEDYSWPSLGIREGNWKLLINQETGKKELYNVAEDWAENKDLAAANPELVTGLYNKAIEWKKTLPANPPARCLSPARAKK